MDVNCLENIKKRTNQERILSSLLKSSKTTAELANKLGYINQEGIALYSVIDKDLKKLEKEGYIKSEKFPIKGKRGISPTLYSIIFDIQNLRKIYKEYPCLLRSIQHSELAFETIFSECIDIFYIYTNEEIMEMEDVKLLINSDKESLKEKLKLSTPFFRIFFINDSLDLRYRLRVITKDANKQSNSEIFILEDNPHKRIIRLETVNGIDILFKSCVSMEIADGREKRRAREYIAKMESETSNKYVNQ